MQDPVKLQEPFTYNGTIIIVLIILIICLIVIFFYKKKDYTNQVKLVHYPNLLTIKNKCLQELDALLYKVNNKIDSREAYYELSKIIRNYVYSATNINVLALSKDEIDNYKIPYLKELMEEYYSPEFSLSNKGNIVESIKKTKEVVNKWR